MNSEPPTDSSVQPSMLGQSLCAPKADVDIEQISPGENLLCSRINLNGPAEDSVATTRVPVPALATNGGAPAIGRPAANPEMRRLLSCALARQLRPVVRAPFTSPTLTGLVPLAAERRCKRDQRTVILISLRSLRHQPVEFLAGLDRFSDAELESLFAKARSQRSANR